MPKGKNEKVIGLMNDELGRKTMATLLNWEQKRIVDGSEDKKAKYTKKCVENLNLKIVITD